MNRSEGISECNGCNSLVKDSNNLNSCKFTNVYIRFMVTCPCRECLVKVTCNSMCMPFIEYLKRRVDVLESYTVGLSAGERKRIGTSVITIKNISNGKWRVIKRAL